MEQKLSQIQGVGQVGAGGGALPSVRVEVNPTKLASYGLTMGNLQSMLRLQNTNLARGQISDGNVSADIVVNGQISHAATTSPSSSVTTTAPRCGCPMSPMSSTRCRTCAGGYLNGKRAVVLIVFRQPGANIIDTVDRIYAQLPSLEASIPKASTLPS